MMLTNRFSIRVFAIALLSLATIALPASVFAIQVKQASNESVPDDKPKLDAFLQLRAQIRSNQERIDKKFGEIPIGFPDIQKQVEQEIADLEKELAVLRSKVKQATIDAYLEDPNNNKLVNTEMLNAIKNALNPGKKWHKFDPQVAMEVSNLILDQGVDSPQIQYLAYRASLALHDFEQAEQLINKIQSTTELNSDVIREFEQLKDKWIREIEIRRLEAANDDLPRVKIETNKGDIIVELFENHAPQTVGNFVNLVEKRFYDNQIFHLVEPGKYAQTGCPDGNGRGGPGYKIYCECYRDSIRDHFAGTISMSHTGEKDSGDSKFFFLQQPDPSLDGKFTVFGRVIQGMDVVYSIDACDKTGVMADSSEPTKIISATVIRKRQHEYVPTKVTE